MNKRLKNAFIAYRKRLLQNKYHKKAVADLASFEAVYGKMPDAEKKQAVAYAGDVLGNRIYASWLMFYAAMNPPFREGFIPPSYYRTEVIYKINRYCRELSLYKTLTRRLLATDAVPDAAYLIDGICYDDRYRPVSRADARDMIFRDTDTVLFKPNKSKQGAGLKVMNAGGFDPAALDKLPDGVFQRYVRHHPFFDEMSPGSAATLRISTVRDLQGNVGVRQARLKVGRSSEKFIDGRTVLAINVDVASGECDRRVLMPDHTWEDVHPDTGCRFAGKRVPAYSRAASLCTSLHERFPDLVIIGWDVTVDPDERIQIFEWNSQLPGVIYSEIMSGPCFKGLGWENLWKEDRWEPPLSF